MKEQIREILWNFVAGEVTDSEAIQQLLDLSSIVGQSEHLICDVCGSNDVIEAPHMGKNCNRCHPI
jgi:hypothetical protein